MHKNYIRFFIVFGMFVSLCFLASCGFTKEVVLEHSVQESVTEAGNMSEEAEESSKDSGEKFSEMPGEDFSQDSKGEFSQISESDVNENQIYVYICGQVNQPGVYQVAADTRVFSVIELAKGLTPEADITGINQAQTVTDGQMLYVPAQGEVMSVPRDSALANMYGDTDEKVNINTADLERLMSLPGIGEGKAQSILQYRQEHGSFKSIEEIMNVDGIKEGTYTKFKDKITV